MGIIEEIKEAATLAQKINQLPLYQKLLNIQGELLKVTEQLQKKEKEITQLKNALSLKAKLICKDSAYFVTDEKGEITDGPFCTKCFDNDHVTIRLVPVDRQDNPEVQCQKCRLQFRSWQAMKYFLSNRDIS